MHSSGWYIEVRKTKYDKILNICADLDVRWDKYKGIAADCPLWRQLCPEAEEETKPSKEVCLKITQIW